jgi:hypothetical protein
MAIKVFTPGKGWRVFAKAINPKLNQAMLQKHVGRATEANGALVRRRVRANIRGGVGMAENAPLTALLKGGKRPIIGTPGLDMFNAITYELQDWRVVAVGVKRTAGDGEVNVAEIVHDGKTIQVTPKMRALFWILWLASKGRIEYSELTGRAKEIFDQTNGAKGIKPIGKGTKEIVIQPRPFLKATIEEDETQKAVRTNWHNAVKATIAEMTKAGEAL